MTLAHPAGLWLLVAGLIPLGLHVLRPRRVESVVSSDLLWDGIAPAATAARPWQRLRPTVLLIAQLLAVALAALALANPVRTTDASLAAHTVVVIDASASMAAIDGTPDRMADAKAEALDIWADLPDGGRASLVIAGPTPYVAVTATTDRAAYESAVRAVRVSDAPADLAGAMALADGLETPDQTVGIVLISDGEHDADALAGLPLGVSHRRVGSGDTNRAVTGLVARPTADGLSVTATIAVTGGPAVTAPLRIDVDGRTATVVDVSVAPGEPVSTSVEVGAGEEVIARLGGEDLLAIDNTGYALARGRREIAVSLDGEPDPFIDAALNALTGVRIVDPAVDIPDVEIHVGTSVPEDQIRPYLAIAPPGGVPGVTPTGSVESPVPTLVRGTDPLLVGLDLSGVRIAESQRVEAPTADVLVGAEGAPLVLRGSRSGVPFVYFAFELGQSTLPLDVSFPVLMQRVLTELSDAATLPDELDVGDTLVPPGGRAATVTDPTGGERRLAAGTGSMLVDRPGFWTVTPDDGAPRTVAVSLPVSESSIRPLPVAPTAPRPLRSGEQLPSLRASWRWLVAVLLAGVALVEWLLARRRVGVPERQWRLATAMRVVGAVALLVALFGPSLSRRSDEVAAVFVLDQSDSVGASGRGAGLDLVEAAAELAPDDARLGVVVAADGARVERLLSAATNSVGLPSVVVEPDRTDLAAGLRLAGAVLPDDARRRVVVVSDGRVTTGDAEAEAARLSDRGIVLDYVVLGDRRIADASIATIGAPERVGEGSAVSVTASIASTVGQPAVVSLRRNGEVVATSDVALVAGRTTVTLRDVPPDGGLVSYDMTVEVAIDDRPQNDTARVAVEVDGPAGVLVIEGSPDAATSLSAALGAGGSTVDTVAVTAIPPLDDLAGYDAVVLVDVAVADVSTERLRDLVTATRDLGRGLVTVGGPQSYGMGGYLDSDLEGVLPVVSDILDPQRRRTVAEVLALDASESMGECHCAEGFSGRSRLAGGVRKTDIARAAAARAIDALAADDQVGVLAVDTAANWVVDLQQLPSEDVVQTGLAKVTPAGGTNLTTTLPTAAAALRQSQAALKHIILFTDGFTEPSALSRLADQAGELLSEGITVSVVATGEGAAPDLEKIAIAGGGRFYPGRDLTRIPEILSQEAVIASRQFINEGEFLPVVTGSSPVVAELSASPPVLGYVATTAKPTARTSLRIGPDEDPLLASWQVGLGRATSWTTDAGVRWTQAWTSWDGYVSFWNRLVQDTFPVDSGGAVRATVDGDEMRVRVEVPADAPTGAVEAQVTDPTGRQTVVSLRETNDGVFEATVPVDRSGSYAVGASIVTGSGRQAVGADLTSLSYSSEYQPGEPNEALLARLSELTGGTGRITAADVFDGTDLVAGRRSVALTGWLIGLAAAAWLAAIVLSRLWLGSRVGADRAVVRGRPRLGRRPGPSDPTTGSRTTEPTRIPDPPPAPSEEAEPTSLDQLLRSKRDRS